MKRSSVEQSDPDDPDELEFDTDTDRRSKKKKKKSQQTSRLKFIHYFTKEWKSQFTWIEESHCGKTFFRCTVCCKDLSCETDGINAVRKHNTREKHVARVKSLKDATARGGTLSQYVAKSTALSLKVKANEIRFAAFFIEHNVPFNTADHLLKLIKSFDPKSEAIQRMSCCRTKLTSLIKSVIGQYAFDSLIDNLKKKKFSLIVDESTDVGTQKNLVVLVRYHNDAHVVVDQFLALLKVEQGTAEGLYTLVTEFFNENGIPYKSNLVAFASDGANLMFGQHNSLMALLKKDVKNLFVMKCICHSIALCASYACNVIPKEVESLLYETYTYFKYSSVRTNELNNIQELLELPVRKLLKLHKVRWLSLQAVVNRFVELYDALFHYFKKETEPERNQKNMEAINIFKKLRNHMNLIYLKFLKFILPFVNEVNVEFQSEKPKIHRLYQRMESTFKTIAAFYLDEDYVEKTDVRFLQFEDPTKFVDLKKIDVGPLAKNELATLSRNIQQEEVINFRKTVQLFYVELLKNIYKRFPFHEKQIQMLQETAFIDPQELKTIKSISVLAEVFEMDIHLTDIEYRKFRRQYKDTTVTDIQQFWQNVRRDFPKEYANILELVDLVGLLPHTSSDCERSFSDINLNKSKLRNRLDTDTVSGLLHGKSSLKVMNCYDYESNDAILKYFNAKMYDFKNEA